MFEYVTQRANSETLMAFQIETAGALSCVEEICALPGVDVCFIGPGDLATDMGLVREVGLPACFQHPEFLDAERRVAAACRANSVVAGYWLGVMTLEPAVELGFRFFVVDGDVAAVQAVCEASLAEKRRIVSELTLEHLDKGGAAQDSPSKTNKAG